MAAFLEVKYDSHGYQGTVFLVARDSNLSTLSSNGVLYSLQLAGVPRPSGLAAVPLPQCRLLALGTKQTAIWSVPSVLKLQSVPSHSREDYPCYCRCKVCTIVAVTAHRARNCKAVC